MEKLDPPLKMKYVSLQEALENHDNYQLDIEAYTSGLDEIDTFIGGVPAQGLTVISAPEGFHKTNLCAQLFSGLLIATEEEILPSVYMSFNHRISYVTDLCIQNIEQYERVPTEKAEELFTDLYKKNCCRLMEGVCMSLDYLVYEITRLAKEEVSMFFIDSINCIYVEHLEDEADLNNRLHIFDILRNLARELKVSIVVTNHEKKYPGFMMSHNSPERQFLRAIETWDNLWFLDVGNVPEDYRINFEGIPAILTCFNQEEDSGNSFILSFNPQNRLF